MSGGTTGTVATPATPVDEPLIDNTKYERNEDIVSKALLNYVEMKKYAQKLLKSQDVCK